MARPAIPNECHDNKGRFSNQKLNTKKRKRSVDLEAARAKKRRLSEGKNSKEECTKKDSVIRIVDLDQFLLSLKCKICNEFVDFNKRIEERRAGLHSTFIVPCGKCNVHQRVETGTFTNNFSDLNSALAIGENNFHC